MIPLAAIPWRLVGAVGLVVAVALMGWRVSAWHASYKALPGVQEALERETSCAPKSKCRERQIALQEAAEHERVRIEADYERQLADLRSHPPAPVVRLCRPRGTGGVPGAAATGPADGAAPGRDVPLEASGDIGQRLFDLADEADREALKLRYLQDWNRALSEVPDEPRE